MSVIAWRIDRLRDAGFKAWLAKTVAHDARWDLHALLELTDRGCSAELAVRILPALGEARPARTNAQNRLTPRAEDMRSAAEPRASTGWLRNSAAAGTEIESRSLTEGLSATGAERDAALVQLHVLLSRAARFEVNRRGVTSPPLGDGDRLDLAHQGADDARVALLLALDAFRGESRFRTWAYKFAVHEAAVRVRKRAWQGHGIPLEAATWPLTVADPQSTGRQSAETTEMLAALSESIERELSPHRREVLVAIALNDVPIDVLAERLNTTRGDLYKTLRDGRQQLRAALTARGLDVGDQLPRASMTRPTCRDPNLLIAQLTGPAVSELNCETCFEALDRYVEFELAGSDADTAIPGMRAHLEGCSACAEDHEGLHALLVSEAGSDSQ